MQIFEIENNIPLPPRTYETAPSPYPVVQLSPGNSFFVPFGAIKKDGKPLELKKVATRITVACAAVRKKYKDRKFVTRLLKEENGVRCWRLT